MYIPTHFAPDDEEVHELLAQTGTSIATLKTIAVVCSHQGNGLKRKWCAPMIG